ncbi:MAG: 50S ribosomal protein L19 [Flavobacteriales bacterium]
MDIVKEIEQDLQPKKEIPEFSPGDTVSVDYRIREGEKERIQRFKGVVLQRKGSGVSETFTVRKVSGNTAIERIFPLHSPFIKDIKVNKRGVVRRSKIYYIRHKKGKAARIKERRMVHSNKNKN